MRERLASGRTPAGWVLFLLVGLLALTVAGCGQPPPNEGGGSGGGGGGGQQGGETTAEETTSEETTSEETTSAVEVGGTPGLAEAADEYEAYVEDQVHLLEEKTAADKFILDLVN